MADYNEPYLTIKPLDIVSDIAAADLPIDVWSDGKNVRFTDGGTEKMTGHKQVYGTPSTAPNWLYHVGYGASLYWVYASDSAVYVTDGTTHNDITPAAGVSAAIGTNWNGGTINNLLVMNNTLEAPIWWNGSPSTPMTALPAWPTNYLAKSLRPYKNYLVALNLYDGSDSYPDAVLWSHPAAAGSVPSSWDITDPTKDAGQYELSETRGEIVDGLQLGDSFIIYKRGSCHSMQYVGGRSIMSFRTLTLPFGMLAAGCAARVGRQHLVLTGDDLVLHDGVDARSVVSKKVRKRLFNGIDPTYFSRSFVVYVPKKKEVWVCYPTSGNELADQALVWSALDDTVSFRDLPGVRHGSTGVVSPTGVSTTWDSDSEVWDDDTTTWDQSLFTPSDASLLLGYPAGVKIYEADQTNLFDGAPMDAYVTRESMPLLDRHNVKLLKSIRPAMTSMSGGTVYFRIGTQMSPKDAINWSAQLPFVLGTDTKIDYLAKGRLFSLQCRSTTDVDWRLDSLDLEIELAERY